ncbi:transcriptional regulator, partial [Streptomyces sp. NPDC001939]
LTVTDRTLRAWLEGRRSPSKASLARIEGAYSVVRRQNVARYLLGRLNREGRGTRVEFHPLNQSQVTRPHQRVVEYRAMNVRRWDRIVGAWADGDFQGLDAAWTGDVLPDLGSQWGQYEYVTNIGFAA